MKSKTLLLSTLLLGVAGILLLSEPAVAAREVRKPKVSFRPKAVLRKKSNDKNNNKAVAPTTPRVANTLPNALAGSLVFAGIEQLTKMGLAKADIKFPAMLGGCLGLFFLLLVTEAISPSAAAAVFDGLTPAATLLAKWIAPFFVPGLVILPLSPSVGGTGEILKVILTVAVGFIFTITSSTYAVVGLRKLQGTYQEGTVATSGKASAGPAAKPFSKESWGLFWKASLLFGAASIWATQTGNKYATPIQTVFLSCLTLACYIWSANLPSAFVKIVHPLATSSVLVLLFIDGLAAATKRDFKEVLKTYRVSSLDPMKAGAGDILMYLLGPSVVAFGVSVYSRRTLLSQNFLSVLLSVLTASAGSLFATALFVRALSLGAGNNSLMIRLSLVSRNITTALALVISKILGGDISITASVVCLTGILGGTYGKGLLDALGITDPICRGLGMGCSAQGLGVAAMANEADAFPFAAIAMVLTAIAATSFVSIPAFKDALIKVASDAPKVAAGAAAAAVAASATASSSGGGEATEATP